MQVYKRRLDSEANQTAIADSSACGDFELATIPDGNGAVRRQSGVTRA